MAPPGRPHGAHQQAADEAKQNYAHFAAMVAGSVRAQHDAYIAEGFPYDVATQYACHVARGYAELWLAITGPAAGTAKAPEDPVALLAKLFERGGR